MLSATTENCRTVGDGGQVEVVAAAAAAANPGVENWSSVRVHDLVSETDTESDSDLEQEEQEDQWQQQMARFLEQEEEDQWRDAVAAGEQW